MKMTSKFGSARRVGVRGVFSDEAVWRDALGGPEPLHVASTDGPLDAPESMPGGGMAGFNGTLTGKPHVQAVVVFREGSILW